MEQITSAQLIKDDPYLAPFQGNIDYRYRLANSRIANFKKTIKNIQDTENGIEEFTRPKLGFFVDEKEILYREWAPNAKQAFLIGDFNNWDRNQHEMKRNEFGVFEIRLAHVNKTPVIPHNTKVKISLVLPNGERVERIPAWIKRAVQDLSKSPVYDGVFWNPPKYKFQHPVPPKPKTLKIYESHVGIASPEYKVADYDNFTDNVLPRIRDLGYNTIQLMAIMEHPYYASFGYQVTNFFAPTSRCGTPEQLMRLIDVAHSYGITVLLDVVHSHACKNVLDGLNQFDGTDHQYFHEGGRGYHNLWDSRLFNYSHHEVMRFLLCNLRYWIEEYKFDGFRFDGVTSMLYHHHGLGTGFGGGYNDYFGDAVDLEAVNYLMVANYMIKTLFPHVTTIAEDVSGMPSKMKLTLALCRPVEEGGIGFDYRLNMAVPDMWIKLLKEKADDDWDMGNIVHTLTNRRWNESTIAYAESHDQALVGDKTLAFWLMDKEMYFNMSELSPLTPVIDRGIALHKMIRLITCSMGGKGYLNFIGNEFGHPEWLDFPREGNGNSFHHARRQFNLIDDKLLRYKYLYQFDKAMLHLEDKTNYLSKTEYTSLKHEGDKIIVFEKDDLLFVFNFHPTKSFTDYKVGTCGKTEHLVVLDTDSKEFGGHGRIDHTVKHVPTKGPYCNREYCISLYIPCRTAFVLQFKH
ncbi:alpha-1,4-glucan branching enzyme [Boothiomyces sp. JEL0866]|nr:alpha-1,4-glucan branching enzyme [Boothiomyces sp. JEL0866]